MTVNERQVEVICRNKRDGKQMASQKLLQLLHPHISSWGSLLKMYGSRAINAQKNKKERESEVNM
jgi:microprocessor complex subunit DGCR8